jgi:sugar-specific transcriptional regulator TrmB
MSLPRSSHCDVNSIHCALQTTFAGAIIANTSHDCFPTQGDTVVLLQQLGFGGYEARAYIALLQRNPLNGYELAKASGMPRSNIYTVLQKLEERGAVMRLEMPGGARYIPVPPQKLMAQLGTRFQHALDAAQHSLETLPTLAEPAYIWNLQGHTMLLEHAHTLVDAGREQLLVAIARPQAAALTEPLAQAEARGVQALPWPDLPALRGTRSGCSLAGADGGQRGGAGG